jgi:predicted O-methyltransferase YrrM
MDINMKFEDYTRPEFFGNTISSGWYPAKGIPEVLGFRSDLKGIEIGSCLGGSTHYLLSCLPNSHIIAIDPYEEYDQMSCRDKAYEMFQTVMKTFPTRLTLIRSKSDDAVNEIENETMDFIFIDGYHSNDQVRKDIENYYPKLKSGGLLCGHDYSAWSLSPAVDEMAKKYGKKVLLCEQDVWYFYKEIEK